MMQRRRKFHQHYSTPYLKNLAEQLKAETSKAQSVEMRRRILQRQKVSSYQLEYDRIQGVLHSSLLSNAHPDFKRLKDRAKHLRDIAGNSLLSFKRSIED